MRALLLLTCALLLGACGPTEMESGQAVLMAAPLITLVGALVAAAYAHAWRPLAEELRFEWRPSFVVIAVQVLACVGVLLSPELEGDWITMALWMVGTSYLSVHCLLLRLGVTDLLRTRFSWLALGAWLPLYLPALALAYFGSTSEELQAFPGLLWTMPGYGGLVTGPLLLLLFLEVVLRRRALAERLRREALPAELPQARVV